MTRTFIQTSEFVKNWRELGFTDDDLRKLELEILRNPKVGSVIHETVYLITVYPKSKKDNLSRTERNVVKKLIEVLEKSL